MVKYCQDCAHFLSPTLELPCSACVVYKDKPMWVAVNTGQEPKKGRSNMQTYRYEIVAPAVLDKDGNVVDDKVAIRIAHGDGLLEAPSTLDLIEKHHDQIIDAGRKYTEVEVHIRPFCG